MASRGSGKQISQRVGTVGLHGEYVRTPIRTPRPKSPERGRALQTQKSRYVSAAYRSQRRSAARTGKWLAERTTRSAALSL
jgi:hypothetical protein